MKLLINGLLVAGVCVAAVGGGGFHGPERKMSDMLAALQDPPGATARGLERPCVKALHGNPSRALAWLEATGAFAGDAAATTDSTEVATTARAAKAELQRAAQLVAGLPPRIEKPTDIQKAERLALLEIAADQIQPAVGQGSVLLESLRHAGALGAFEPSSLGAFILGLLLLGAGGFLHRRTLTASSGESQTLASPLEEFRGKLDEIRSELADLVERSPDLAQEELRESLSQLIDGPLFELTARNEEFLALVGVRNYAGIWEGIATGERLVARAWSMTTDGFPEQGAAELPIALQALEQAREGMDRE